jgi:hypothetical protein
MTDPPSSSTTSSSWGVSEEEAAELMRVHRDQLLMYEELSTEPAGTRNPRPADRGSSQPTISPRMFASSSRSTRSPDPASD